MIKAVVFPAAEGCRFGVDDAPCLRFLNLRFLTDCLRPVADNRGSYSKQPVKARGDTTPSLAEQTNNLSLIPILLHDLRAIVRSLNEFAYMVQ